MKTVKIDKRACRKVGAEPLNIPIGNGMLHDDNIKYLVRTRVKVIAHHRLLVVYFYACERVRAGDRLPIWTVFQSRSDFLVQVRDEAGVTKWSTAAIDAYSLCYPRIGYASVFYTLSDKTRLEKYLHNGRDGIKSLICAQSQIKEVRAKEKRDCRDRKIIKLMQSIPKPPRDLRTWAGREAVPTYLFYDYKRTKAPIPAYCTHCHKTVEIVDARHGKEVKCPRCGWSAVMKARGRRGQIYDRSTCNIVQKIDTMTLVIRTFKLHVKYNKSDDPTIDFYENARVFLQYQGGCQCDSQAYYYSYWYDGLTKWKHGRRPFTYSWGYNFEADSVGHLYYKNLDKELMGTPWQYVPIKMFYLQRRLPMEVPCYLESSLKHPKIEHLVKVGFYTLASDLAYGRVYSSDLDEAQNRTHRLLRVQKDDLPFLHDLDVSIKLLRMFQKYCKENIKDRKQLLVWQKGYGINTDLLDFLSYMTPHKLMSYLERQLKDIPYFHSIGHVVEEYRDYLNMSRQLRYDLKNSFVLFPADCHCAHDKAMHHINRKAAAKERRAFRRAYQRIQNSLDYEKGGMRIIYPKEPEEIVKEGQILHHCVGSYVSSVADNKCIILFLRKTEELDRPFFTIEVRGGEVRQIRGQNNIAPTPEVQKFMTAWEKCVLHKATLPSAA